MMSKHPSLNLRVILCLVAMLSLGIGRVYAETITFIFSDYNGQGGYNGGAEYVMDKGDIKIGDTKFYGSTQYVSFAEGGVTTISPASGVTIKNIAITTKDNLNGFQTNGVYTPSVGDVALNETDKKVVEWRGSATSSFTIGHSKTIRWTSIVVTYEKGMAASHMASFSINGIVDARYNCVVAEGESIAFPDVPPVCGTDFVGWSKDAIVDKQSVEPPVVDVVSETMGATDIVYYAVFTSEAGEGCLDLLTKDSKLKDGDCVAVIVNVKGQYMCMCQSASADGGLDCLALDGVPTYSLLTSEAKRHWRLTDAGNGGWYLGDGVYGYLHGEDNALSLSMTDRSVFSVIWNYDNGCFNIEYAEEKRRIAYYASKFQGESTSQVKGNSDLLLYRLTSSKYFTSIPTVTVNLAATDGRNYYATFCNANNVTMPKTLADGSPLRVAAVTAAGEVARTLDVGARYGCEADGSVVVPANTGVLLVVEGASQPPTVEYGVYVGDVPGRVDVLNSDNMLVACLEDGGCPSKARDCFYYKLAYGDNAHKSALGFWWGCDDGSNAFSVKGGGAVLCVPQAVASNIRGFKLDGGDTLTVAGCCADAADGATQYDLWGRHIGRQHRGVCVENGRKCIR